MKSLPDVLELILQSLNVVSGFKTDIRSIGREIPAAISGAHGFVSPKSFVSLQLTRWSLTKLLQNVSSFGYNQTNLLSMMTLSVEHFHSTTHAKNVLMTQLQYARESMRSIKEALKRCHPWSACYFTSRKASWYPPTENDINFRDISPILPSKAVPSSITVADEETLPTWANTYTRAVRQGTVCQEKTMAKRGTLPHYLYTAKISEVAEITEEHSIPLIVPADGSTAVVNEKEVVIEEVQGDDNEKSDEFEPSSEEEEELDNAHQNIATSTTDVADLDEGSLFLVGRSTRFGRSIKINSKFIRLDFLFILVIELIVSNNHDTMRSMFYRVNICE